MLHCNFPRKKKETRGQIWDFEPSSSSADERVLCTVSAPIGGENFWRGALLPDNKTWKLGGQLLRSAPGRRCQIVAVPLILRGGGAIPWRRSLHNFRRRRPGIKVNKKKSHRVVPPKGDVEAESTRRHATTISKFKGHGRHARTKFTRNSAQRFSLITLNTSNWLTFKLLDT